VISKNRPADVVRELDASGKLCDRIRLVREENTALSAIESAEYHHGFPGTHVVAACMQSTWLNEGG
jgi:hypothetical protein